MFNNKIVTITGGTGSFGKNMIKSLIRLNSCKEIRILSRDEMKQWHLQEEYKNHKNLKFIIGDVKDRSSIDRAIKGSHFVIHAAATKIVPTAESNPTECIKTNINGAINVIDSCIKNKVKKVVALSTDKACNPVNLYGATKLCSDKLFVSANFLENNNYTSFSVVRYGNVMGSRGSVIPFFLNQEKNKKFTITDKRMTRFMITLDQAINLVKFAFKDSLGGEIYVSKIPSMKIIDIAKAINNKNKIVFIGIRPGEKFHEVMISKEDSLNTFEYKYYYKIIPFNKNKKYIKSGKKVPLGFEYSSENNSSWMKTSTLKSWIKNFLKLNDLKTI